MRPRLFFQAMTSSFNVFVRVLVAFTSDELNRRSRTCITCKDLYGFTLFFILFCIGCKRSKLQADKFKFACFRASMCTLFSLYSVYD